jgi:Tfp pilus assembly protein PilF
MATDEERQEALRLLEEANRCHLEGDIEEAIRLYQASIERFPTADAHTYLGWMYSFQGRVEEAIQECQVAIELDPDFGNPYNDIGVYLMTQGKLKEAMPWLEKAKMARRYEPRHFPYLNLGRIHLARGRLAEALAEFRRALEIRPEDPSIRRAIVEVQSRLN